MKLGCSEVAISWFWSHHCIIKLEISQGYYFAQLRFRLYTKDITEDLDQNITLGLIYADDLQIYVPDHEIKQGVSLLSESAQNLAI